MRLFRVLAATAAMVSAVAIGPAGMAATTPDQPAVLHLVRGGGFGGHGGGFGGHGGGFGGRGGGFAGRGGGFAGHDGGFGRGYAGRGDWGYRPWRYGYGGYPFVYGCPYAYSYPYCAFPNG
jgi:hypothetical protein